MTRALLILVAGIALAVLSAAAIAGGRDLLAVMGPVLVTTAIGLAVMAVVAWRARIRQRAQDLEDQHPVDTERPTNSTTTTEDTHRG